jgi:uncharacterized protein involved in outer membrane biogenesis
MEAGQGNRKLKRWLWVGLAGLALIAVIVGVLVATIDVEPFVRSRLGLVEEATGRSLRIGGKLSVRVLPRIIIVAEDVAFANAKWGSQPDMLRVKRLEGALALIPLLQRRIEVVRLVLVEPQLLLETDAGGNGNWFLQQKKKPATPSDGAEGFGIVVPSVIVEKGRVTFRERGAAPFELAIERMSLARAGGGLDELELRAALREQPFTIKGTMGAVERLLQNDPKWPLNLTLGLPGTEVKFDGHLDRSKPRVAVNGKVAAEIRELATLSKLAGMNIDLPVPAALDATLAASQDVQRIEPMVLRVGKTSVEGSVAVDTKGAQPRINARLASKDLDLARPSGGGQKAGASDSPGRVFSEAPLPFTALTKADAEFDMRIDRLRLPDGLPLANVHVRGALANGRMIAEPVALNLAGGNVTGRLELQAAENPRSALRFDAKGISMSTLASQLGKPIEMSGGATDALVDLSMSGASLHQMAASASGTMRVVVGPTRLAAGVLPRTGEVVASLLNAVNPLHKSESGTQVRCAVAVLPVRAGVATIDRTIAVETSKLNVVASGTIDFGAERLNLSFRPTVKEGLGIGAINLAQFVSLTGPLQSPKVGIDPKGTLEGALSLGAAVATGGMSSLGERLLKQPSDPHPCKTALSGKPAPAEKPTPAEKPAPTDPATLLKGLFGKR